MRCAIILAGVVTAMSVSALSATGAQAQEYCGFSTKPGSIVECGYSSLDGCENALGKGAMCFINPYLGLNTRRAPAIASKPAAERS